MLILLGVSNLSSKKARIQIEIACMPRLRATLMFSLLFKPSKVLESKILAVRYLDYVIPTSKLVGIMLKS